MFALPPSHLVKTLLRTPPRLPHSVLPSVRLAAAKPKDGESGDLHMQEIATVDKAPFNLPPDPARIKHDEMAAQVQMSPASAMAGADTATMAAAIAAAASLRCFGVTKVSPDKRRRATRAPAAKRALESVEARAIAGLAVRKAVNRPAGVQKRLRCAGLSTFQCSWSWGRFF